jgi:hypothetical protein
MTRIGSFLVLAAALVVFGCAKPESSKPADAGKKPPAAGKDQGAAPTSKDTLPAKADAARDATSKLDEPPLPDNPPTVESPPKTEPQGKGRVTSALGSAIRKAFTSGDQK